MEYGKIEPIQGKNGYEKTALTMKTISELLAEEGTSMEEVIKAAPPAKETIVPRRPLLQQPPHMQVRTTPVSHQVPPKAASLPPIAPAVLQGEAAVQDEKPRSFLSRLIGR